MLKITKNNRGFIFLNERKDGWTTENGSFLTLPTIHMLKVFFGEESVEEANKKIKENYLYKGAHGSVTERKKKENGKRETKSKRPGWF